MKRLMYLLLGAAALTACTNRQTTQTKTDEGVLTKTAAAEKALRTVVRTAPGATTEELVRLALKEL